MADIGAGNWNENDTNNNQPAPDGAPEGMSPSGVNDTIRAVMGALKRWFNWSSPKVTAGSATAYTLTYGVAPGALVDGMTHLVQFHASQRRRRHAERERSRRQAAVRLQRRSWYQAPPAFFDVATVCRVVYDAGTGAYRLLMPGAVPTGTVVPFAGSVAPAGYLLAFGQAVSRTNYPGLFAVINTTYGIGDGSTTFNVPDLRGCVAGRQRQYGRRRTGVAPVQRHGVHDAGCSGAVSRPRARTYLNVASSRPRSSPAAFRWMVRAQVRRPNQASARTHAILTTFTPTSSARGTEYRLSVNGNTTPVSNVQPTFILNQIIKL